MQMNFHWGATPESDEFFNRHPRFHDAVERLMAVLNTMFGREYTPKDRLEDIGFSLGETCRIDFLEIVFLAVHGWGIGSSKLLRGLYERAVALAYMIRHPEKAERFVRYAAIQEYKVMIPAVELAGDNAFDAVMAGTTSVAQIKAYRDMVKAEFEIPVCRKCYKAGVCTHRVTAASWDEKGVLAQVQELGEPYTKFYVGSYALPNMHVHASLTSAMQEADKESDEQRATERRRMADFTLMNAHAVMLMAARSQNNLFSLRLEEELELCETDWASVWTPASDTGTTLRGD